MARVLEGPVPTWKIFGAPGAGNGAGGTSFGLPRFASASFRVRFPFATVTLGSLSREVAASGQDIDKAREKVYKNLPRIHFDGAHYRHDIALV